MSDLINEVKDFKNVKIVTQPAFIHYYTQYVVNEMKLLSSAHSVYPFDNPTIDYIKSNEHKSMFYIYKIEENYARWFEMPDPEYIKLLELKKTRKEKLKKLEIYL